MDELDLDIDLGKTSTSPSTALHSNDAGVRQNATRSPGNRPKPSPSTEMDPGASLESDSTFHGTIPSSNPEKSTFRDIWKRSTADHFGRFRFPLKDSKMGDNRSSSHTSPMNSHRGQKMSREKEDDLDLESELGHLESQCLREEEEEEKEVRPGWCIKFCMRSCSDRQSVNRWLMWQILLFWLLLGLGLVALTFSLLYVNASRERMTKLMTTCKALGDIVKIELDDQSEHVYKFTDLISTFYYGASPKMLTQDQFMHYDNNSNGRLTEEGGLVYVERVSAASRSAFESDIGSCISNFSGLCTKQQDEYSAVLFHSSSGKGNQSYFKIGLDYSSDLGLNATMARARDRGLHGANSDPLGVCSYSCPDIARIFPVYADVGPPVGSPVSVFREATLGFLVSLVNFSAIAESAYRGDPAQFGHIDAAIVDMTQMEGPVILWKSSSALPKLRQFSSLDLDLGDPDRLYVAKCRYRSSSWFPWVTVYVSLAVLLAVTVIFWIIRVAILSLQRMGRDYQHMKSLKERMAEAKVAAESASRAKGAFLATMSHEIRTPMNGVIGMLNLLLGTRLDATQLDYVETARTSGRALCALINDVLDLSKIEAGHMNLENIPFNLGSEIDDVISMFAEKARENASVELASIVQDSVPARVVGDPLRFRQVLINLIGNSFKFTKGGHILVTVRMAGLTEDLEASEEPEEDLMGQPWELQREASLTSIVVSSRDRSRQEDAKTMTLSGREAAYSCNSWSKIHSVMANCGQGQGFEPGQMVRLVISCEDTGIGIPEWAKLSIFKPFTQADTSTTRLHGGTGIGLTICQRLVRMMGGKLSFVSKVDVGTTFFFDCFLEVADPSAPLHASESGRDLLSYAPSTSSSVAESGAHQVSHGSSFSEEIFRSGGGARESILVVDHRPVRRAVIGWHIRRLGLDADFCDSPEDALSRLRMCCPHVDPSSSGSQDSDSNSGQDLLWRAASRSSKTSQVRKVPAGTRDDDLDNRVDLSSVQLQLSVPAKKYCAVFVDFEEVRDGPADVPAGRGAGSRSGAIRSCSLLTRSGCFSAVSSGHGKGANGGGLSPCVIPPLVLLTGERGTERMARSAGFDAVMLKPLRRGSLSACLLQLFSGSGLARTSSGGVVAVGQSELRSSNGNQVKPESEVEVGWQDQRQVSDLLTAFFSGKTVLVVDDNLVNRKVMSKTLQRYGAKTELVDGGHKAIQTLKQTHKTFDIVFMDVQMPLMDGYEATQRIREWEAGNGTKEPRHVPIFALTADIVVGTREKCISSGMDGFLSKPIEEEQLFRVLSPLFGKQRDKGL